MSNTKIVFVQGSPRQKGNTRAAATAAMEAARQAGAEVAEIDATKLQAKVNGCLGCDKCRNSDQFGCTLGDDVARAVLELPQHDVVVIASPLYFWSFTAQAKIFIDRIYSLSKVNPDGTVNSLLGGKTLALLATGGGPVEDNLELLERQWKKAALRMGCSFDSCLLPLSPRPEGALGQDQSAMDQAREFGRRLAG